MSKKNKSKSLQRERSRMIKSEEVVNVGNDTVLIMNTDKSFLPVAEIKKEVLEELEEIKTEIGEEVLENVKELRESRWRCVIC